MNMYLNFLFYLPYHSIAIYVSAGTLISLSKISQKSNEPAAVVNPKGNPIVRRVLEIFIDTTQYTHTHTHTHIVTSACKTLLYNHGVVKLHYKIFIVHE